MISSDGWLSGALACPSPNTNQRPQGVAISLLVIHNISLPPGEFGGGHVQALFTNTLNASAHPYFESLATLEVSAHLFIDRAGKITQFAPFTARAWHAGVSSFDGVENCNDYSIGIELEGCDDVAYTDEQYAVLAKITHELFAAYPAITLARIVGHSDVAPGRKTDPGAAFDWSRYRALLSGESLSYPE